MIKTSLIAVLTYVATSIDEIPVLFMLYRKADTKEKGKIITLGYYLGTFMLIALAMLSGMGLGFVLPKWILGFTGLVPFVLGLKILIFGEKEEFLNSKKYQSFMIRILAITIGLGADDLGVYIPLFSVLSIFDLAIMILIFFLGTTALCYISQKLTQIKGLTEFVEKYERLIVSFTFLLVGIIILTDCGTLSKVTSYFVSQK